MSLPRFSPAARAVEIKVFWFFFSKKNCFLFNYTPQTSKLPIADHQRIASTLKDQAMKQAPTITSTPQPAADRPRAIMRGKRHFLNLEGEAAAQAGLPNTSVPYDAGSLENMGWMEGWARGHAVSEIQDIAK